MKQFSLFEAEDSIKESYEGLIKVIGRTGKTYRYLDALCRGYMLEKGTSNKRLLEALMEVERYAMGICTIAGEISSPRPLKIDKDRLTYSTNIKDEYILHIKDKDRIEQVLKNIPYHINTLNRILNSICYRTSTPWIVEKENIISEYFQEMKAASRELELVIKEEILEK